MLHGVSFIHIKYICKKRAAFLRNLNEEPFLSGQKKSLPKEAFSVSRLRRD